MALRTTRATLGTKTMPMEIIAFDLVRAERRDYQHRQQQAGEGHHDVGATHQDLVHPPSDVTRKHPDQHSDEDPEQRACTGHEHGQPRSGDDPGEDVAAVAVGAEPELRRRPDHAGLEVELVEGVGRNPGPTIASSTKKATMPAADD